jgi:hypothetical protein
MINYVMQLLKITQYYGISESIEIAKGKNKIPKTVKEIFEQARRLNKIKKTWPKNTK